MLSLAFMMLRITEMTWHTWAVTNDWLDSFCILLVPRSPWQGLARLQICKG